LQTGTPLDNERFKAEIEATLDLKVGFARRGRPRKNKVWLILGFEDTTGEGLFGWLDNICITYGQGQTSPFMVRQAHHERGSLTLCLARMLMLYLHYF